MEVVAHATIDVVLLCLGLLLFFCLLPGSYSTSVMMRVSVSLMGRYSLYDVGLKGRKSETLRVGRLSLNSVVNGG